jgi:hypothetical protein
MNCVKGFELEEVHDIALRVCLEALAAVRLTTPNDGLTRVALDKAVALQRAYDELIGHINDCPACEASEGHPCRNPVN